MDCGGSTLGICAEVPGGFCMGGGVDSVKRSEGEQQVVN